MRKYTEDTNKITGLRGVLSDKDLIYLNEHHKIIQPFCPFNMKTRQNIFDFEDVNIASKGLNKYGYGYDISLASNNFLISKKRSWVSKIWDFLTHTKYSVDVKDIRDTQENFHSYEIAEPTFTDSGDYFILPAYSHAIGFSDEYINLPSNVIGLCFSKLTYAKVGIITNVTPIDNNWSGKIKISLINPTPNNVKIYANEGIAKVIFIANEYHSLILDKIES